MFYCIFLCGFPNLDSKCNFTMMRDKHAIYYFKKKAKPFLATPYLFQLFNFKITPRASGRICSDKYLHVLAPCCLLGGNAAGKAFPRGKSQFVQPQFPQSLPHLGSHELRPYLPHWPSYQWDTGHWEQNVGILKDPELPICSPFLHGNGS